MLGAAPIENIKARKLAFYEALKSALTTRIIKRTLMDYRQHKTGEMKTGVVMIVGDGEGSYSQAKAMAAKEGVTYFLLVAHVEVGDSNAATMGQSVEDAEDDLIEEIKSFVKAGIPGMDLKLENVKQSRQLEAPMGWIVAKVSAGAPRSTIS